MAKLLIVEDDALVSRMYKQAFAAAGFTVTIAANGRVGLTKAQEIKPDIILCDIMMPEMNGLEVLEALKSDPALKGIPVVMLTNLAGTQDAQTAKTKGAKAYLVKSEYKPKEVVEKVKTLLA